MENSSTQTSTFDRVFELINNIATAEEYKDKVSVLPIMCGTGKSTAISRLIKQSIERNEGLIVLTDRIDSLLSYLNPHEPDIKEFIDQHLDKITVMHSGRIKQALETYKHTPVLMMTTQRYCMPLRTEFDEFRTWDGGYRKLIVFDEQPILFEDVDLSVNSIYNACSAVFYGLKADDKRDDHLSELYRRINETTIKQFMKDFSLCKSFGRDIIYPDSEFNLFNCYRDSVEEAFDIASQKPNHLEGRKTTCYFHNERYNTDFKNFDPDKQIVETDKNGVKYVYEDKETWWQVYSRSDFDIEDDLECSEYIVSQSIIVPWEIFLSIYRDKNRIMRYDSKAPQVFHAILNLSRLGSIRHFRSNGSDICDFGEFVSTNNDWRYMYPEGKVIILDGTADLTTDYKQDYIHIHESECSEFRRRIPNLTIKLVDYPAGKKTLIDKIDSDTIMMIRDWIIGGDQTIIPCIFTYKDVQDKLEEEIRCELDKSDAEPLHDCEDNDQTCNESACKVTEEGQSCFLINHFGKIKGSNAYAHYNTFAQIGVLRKPDYYYLSHYLSTHHDELSAIENHCFQRQDLEHPFAAVEATEQIMNSEGYKSYVMDDMLIDIEQNIFRSSIRNQTYTGHVDYYIFFNHRYYPELIQRIIQRFGHDGLYGANVEIVKAPQEIVQSALEKQTRNDQPTIIAHITQWLKELPSGKEFRTKDILEGVDISQDQFYKAKRNRALKDLLSGYTDPNKRRNGFYKKP